MAAFETSKNGMPAENIESTKEKDPALQEIAVYRVRHGESVYDEHTGGRTALAEDNQDLTEEGVRDIHRAAETIAARIDPARDIVVVVHSPRRRAESAGNLIKQDLQARFGEEIIYKFPEKQEKHATQPRVSSFEMVDEKGIIIPIDDPRYPGYFSQQLKVLSEASAKEGIPTGGYIISHGFEGFENYSNVIKRTRDQLTFLMRLARKIQPKVAKEYGKRLVIVETEHNESLDDLAEQASRGRFTLKKSTGVNPGEVMEIIIPTQGNEIKVSLPQREGVEPMHVTYDPDKREFGN